jgi:hypothetical protein
MDCSRLTKILSLNNMPSIPLVQTTLSRSGRLTLCRLLPCPSEDEKRILAEGMAG